MRQATELNLLANPMAVLAGTAEWHNGIKADIYKIKNKQISLVLLSNGDIYQADRGFSLWDILNNAGLPVSDLQLASITTNDEQR